MSRKKTNYKKKIIYVYIQGVQEKLYFFTINFNPFLAYIAVKLSTQCECTVTPIGCSFIVQPIAAECWRGRGGKLSRILGKNTIFNEHPVA